MVDTVQVQSLVDTVEAAGGLTSFCSGVVGDELCQKMRVKVSPSRLPRMVRTLLQMAGWRHMAICTDRRFATAVERMVFSKGGIKTILPSVETLSSTETAVDMMANVLERMEIGESGPNTSLPTVETALSTGPSAASVDTMTPSPDLDSKDERVRLPIRKGLGRLGVGTGDDGMKPTQTLSWNLHFSLVTRLRPSKRGPGGGVRSASADSVGFHAAVAAQTPAMKLCSGPRSTSGQLGPFSLPM
ncbi:hypothetical protein FPV67DRAFT_1460749 [Lyophyllum atratum]|nr:hypothetical protein FPV67DRAFT_1460749 [Lyophyllum atratum]